VLDKDSTAAQVAAYFKQIPSDAHVGVMSEAGMPCIADPGTLAVAYCHQQNIPVMPIPGPSSILLALVSSGMSGQSFAFHGYLPVQEAEAAKKLKMLERDALAGQTQILMETPYRNNRLLSLLCSTLREDLLLCIAANISAPDQLLRTQSIAQWRKSPPELHKIPTVFVLGK
jgi:16S rRNA (cytidine1402-2'-O)-methyltransferase